MNKVISAFKKHWNKAVVVFCVVAIVFVTSFSMTSVASADDLSEVISDDLYDWLKDNLYSYGKENLDKYKASVLEFGFDLLRFDTYNVSGGNYSLPDGSKPSGTAYPITATATSSSGTVYNIKAFNDNFLKTYFDFFSKGYTDYSYANLAEKFGLIRQGLNTQEILALLSPNYPLGGYDFETFKNYYNARYCKYLLDNNSDYGDSGYENKNPDDYSYDVRITTDDLKALYTDYSLMYAPMPTPSQYLYNYQSATGEKQTAGYHEFAPCAPLWRSGLGFGADIGSKGGWKKDCYVLPYIYDDDVGSTYYYSGYWHFTIEVDEFYKATYTCDFVSLLGDEDSTQFHLTKSHEYRAYALKVSSGAWIQCFTSDTSFLQGNLALNTSYATVVNAPASKTTYAVSGKLSDLVKNNFGNMLRATTFTPQTNTADDWGYIMSETPFELFKDQTSIDFSRIPNNYTITINGDTIYDYSITNPDTGDSTTIKKYIDDDYDFPQVPDVPDVPDPGDDSGIGGKVEVSGKIDVSGKVDVDVNVNVNSGSSSNPDPGDYIDPGTVDTNLDHYLEQVPKLSKGFIDYLKDFFAWLPDEIYGLIILGLVVMIFCRLAGR